jgi:hypothetical protein
MSDSKKWREYLVENAPLRKERMARAFDSLSSIYSGHEWIRVIEYSAYAQLKYDYEEACSYIQGHREKVQAYEDLKAKLAIATSALEGIGGGGAFDSASNHDIIITREALAKIRGE